MRKESELPNGMKCSGVLVTSCKNRTRYRCDRTDGLLAFLAPFFWIDCSVAALGPRARSPLTCRIASLPPRARVQACPPSPLSPPPPPSRPARPPPSPAAPPAWPRSAPRAFPPARSLGVRDRSVVGPRRPRNPLPSRQVPRPLTPTPPTHRPSAPAQVRGLPRLGAKSARLSTVRTYAAREVGMKKDGTSATVRRPRTTVPAAVSSVARSIDRRAARSPARASATRTARADPRRARRARRAPAAAPPPSRRAPSLAAAHSRPERGHRGPRRRRQRHGRYADAMWCRPPDSV